MQHAANGALPPSCTPPRRTLFTSPPPPPPPPPAHSAHSMHLVHVLPARAAAAHRRHLEVRLGQLHRVDQLAWLQASGWEDGEAWVGSGVWVVEGPAGYDGGCRCTLASPRAPAPHRDTQPPTHAPRMGITSTAAKLVWRAALALKGDWRTRRCVPFSPAR